MSTWFVKQLFNTFVDFFVSGDPSPEQANLYIPAMNIGGSPNNYSM
jgi:hypothetical protein